MSARRQNRTQPTSDPVERYTRWHWGEKPTKQITVDDDRLPEHLVECGKLVQLYVDLYPDGEEVTLTPERGASLCFDLDHPDERLYIVRLPKRVRAAVKRRWCGRGAEWYDLGALAKLAGGRHAAEDYPHIEVAPIGVLTHVVYATHKRGDGPSEYIHHLGEESGIQPILAADNGGDLWIAGGNYQSPYAGITD